MNILIFLTTFGGMNVKHIFSAIIVILFSQTGIAQITITASDMPVAGDTLRFSFASPTATTISPGDSGANVIWDYALSSTGQGVDSYLTALQINPLYLLTVGTTAYGYQIADSLPIPGGILPISIQQVYTFFEKSKTLPAVLKPKPLQLVSPDCPQPLITLLPTTGISFR